MQIVHDMVRRFSTFRFFFKHLNRPTSSCATRRGGKTLGHLYVTFTQFYMLFEVLCTVIPRQCRNSTDTPTLNVALRKWNPPQYGCSRHLEQRYENAIVVSRSPRGFFFSGKRCVILSLFMSCSYYLNITVTHIPQIPLSSGK